MMTDTRWNLDLVRLMVVVCSASIPVMDAQPAAGNVFAAASVKINRSGSNGRQSMTPGRISFRSVSLRECLMTAYELRSYQVAVPALASSERYDVDATAEGPASNAELRAMLKALLAERFQLRTHDETRELQAYRLIATKNTKLTRAAPDQPGSYALEGGSAAFHAMSMRAFADYLSHLGPIDHPVIDGTGMEGVFDFKLKLFEARPDMPMNELKRAYYEWDQGSSIFTDVQEQLGLKLQPEKAPIHILVVDSVAKPSEN
ncbi:MAG: hypothetical protein JWP63_4554 [Candidatus Solibacter sp.]|nr:hypothetical protein [Candidatus Solibacter sp.]